MSTDTATTAQQAPSRQEGATPIRRHGPWLLGLALVVLLGLGLRAWRLDEQSVWLDEYTSAAHVDAPSLFACLRNQSELNDEMVPLYFVLQYYWANLVGTSPVHLRWLSVLLGLLAIPLLYRLGAELKGPAVGLMAALLLASSPFHVFHDQEIRVYSLFTLLGLLSAYTFLRLIRTGAGRWWMLNAFVNGLLISTHLFGFWLIAIEGLFLLCFRRNTFAHILLWGVANALLMAPVGLLVLTWNLDPATGVVPPASEILGSLYGADAERVRWAVAHFTPLPPGLKLPTGLAVAFTHFSPIRLALMGYLAALTACFAWQALRAKRDKGHNNTEAAAFLLFWHILPAPILYLFAWAWSAEAFQYRYVMHSSLALYLIVAWAIAALPVRPLRVLALALLAFLCLPGLVLNTALPMRTNYAAAGQYLHTAGLQPDAVLFYPNNLKRVLDYNMGAEALPLRTARDMGELLESTDDVLERREETVVMLVDYTSHLGLATERLYQSAILERYLEARGLPYDHQTFFGENNIQVYRVGRGEVYRLAHTPESIEALGRMAEAHPKDMDLRVALARAQASAGRSAEAAAQSRSILARLPSDPGARKAMAVERGLAPGEMDRLLDRYHFETLSVLCGELVKLGRLDDALDAYRAAMALPSAQRPGDYIIGRNAATAARSVATALHHSGRFTEAIDVYRQCLPLLQDRRVSLLALADLLVETGEYEEALALCREAGGAGPPDAAAYCCEGSVWEGRDDAGQAQRLFREAIRIDPTFFLPYSRLDNLLGDHASVEERIDVWMDIIETTPSARAHFHLGRAREAAGNLPEAAVAYGEAAALNPRDPAFTASLGQAYLAMDDCAAAIEPLRQALALNPDIPNLRQQLAACLWRQGNVEAARKEAEECTRRGIELPPELREASKTR